MRKRILAALASAAFVLGLGMTVAPAAEAAPYCGITWGSLQKSKAGMSTAKITDFRAGRHDCFDRLVVDLNYKVKGYSVRYVDVVRSPGSGFAVPLSGAADLQITVLAPAYDDNGRLTYNPPANPRQLVNVSGYTTFRQVAMAGSFEGETTLGLGVRARLPMRVLVLDGPGNGSRLVIDVAHKW